ncbi:MAG: hypothetical protein M3R38_33115 [Actinomycetota bacterium]|nr:hypothetical protein [Actinomycetota bacterium]
MRRMFLLVTLGAVVAATMALTGAASAVPGSTDSDASKKLAEVRKVTAKYQDVNEAWTDGYRIAGNGAEEPDPGHCVGGMGYHYVNEALIGDPSVDPLKPEVLLYAPSEAGPRLVGVEYLAVDDDQNVNTHNEYPPSLFGVPFDGPMLGHGPDIPVHYDLHVWTWEANPNGIFAPYNPNVRC